MKSRSYFRFATVRETSGNLKAQERVLDAKNEADRAARQSAAAAVEGEKAR
jgi:hypothetical protein